MQRLQQEAGQAPRQVIAGGAYTSRENIVAMAGQGIDRIGRGVGLCGVPSQSAMLCDHRPGGPLRCADRRRAGDGGLPSEDGDPRGEGPL